MNNHFSKIFLILIGVLFFFLLGGFNFAQADFNPQLNYQGKLTSSSSIPVADGGQCLRFSIQTDATASSSIWSEEWTATSTATTTSTSGLFSVMLGSNSSLAGVDFNQTLYLQVDYDPGCDGIYEEEFSPRKILGAVSAAFEAAKLGGHTWAEPGAIGLTTASSSAFTTLTVSATSTFSGDVNIGSLSGLLKGTSGLISAATAGIDYGIINSLAGISTSTISLIAGTGLSLATTTSEITLTNTGVLSINSATGTLTFASSTSGTDFSIDVSGTTLTWNLPSATSTARGLLTAADWTSFNSKVSSQWTSTSTGIFYNSGNVGIGTSTPAYKLDVVGDLRVTASSTLGNIISGVWQGTAITVERGGTGITTTPSAHGQLLMASSTDWVVGNLLAGSNMTITTSTPGEITFASTGGGGGVATTTPFTAGYIPYATSSLSLTNSNIFQLNGNIGIGTTGPTGRLHIGELNTSGTIGKISYPSSTTLAGAVYGWDLDLSTNVTQGSNSILGLRMTLPSTGTADRIFSQFIEGSTTFYNFKTTQTVIDVPVSFGSAGDVSISYDLQFTNDTASYIRSYAPLYIEAGDPNFNRDLTLRAAGIGQVIVDDSLYVSSTSTFSGNLGIGTTTPAYKLDMQGSLASTYIARIYNTSTATTSDALLISLGVATSSRTTENYFIGFSDGVGLVAGKIQGGANAVAYTTTGADYAEYFPVADFNNLPQPGEIVTFDARKSQAVKKTESKNDIPIGIISTSPGFLGGGPLCALENEKCDENYQKENVIVSLTGRVPIKVSLENGPIEIGDPLISSSIPGVAMKATKPGNTIGRALEPFNSREIGKILTFINVGWYGGKLTENGLLNPERAVEKNEGSSLFDSFVQKIKSVLSFLGVLIENGILRTREVIVDKLTTKTARIEKLEMVDGVTGEIYCTWIENGEWQKVKGECNDQNPNDQTENNPEPAPEPEPEPEPAPEPEPVPEPEPAAPKGDAAPEGEPRQGREPRPEDSGREPEPESQPQPETPSETPAETINPTE